MSRSSSVRVVEHEGRPVKVTRRRGARHSLEITLLFRARDLRRAMDTAWQDFTGHCDEHSPSRLVTFHEAERKVEQVRAARHCASRLAMRRTRHRLSLLELRHGVDAHTVRDALELAHQLSSDESTNVDQLLTIAPVEEGRVCSRPPEEINVNEVGANAPPVGIRRTSNSYRRPPI